MEKTKATNRRRRGRKDGDRPPRHSSFSPWLHENTAKVDLSVKVDVQHLLQVVLKTDRHTHTNRRSKTQQHFSDLAGTATSTHLLSHGHAPRGDDNVCAADSLVQRRQQVVGTENTPVQCFKARQTAHKRYCYTAADMEDMKSFQRPGV